MITFTREEFKKLYGEHPDWMWEMLVENHGGKELRIEDLKADIGELRELYYEVVSQRNKVLSENSRLRKVLESLASELNSDEWSKDIARESLDHLIIETIDSIKEFTRVAKNLEAENIRFRKALEWIAADFSMTQADRYSLQREAREALDGDE